MVFTVALIAGAALWQRFVPNRLEPVYEGRGLGAWLRGHPREYGPAVQAVGVQATPYLLEELSVHDPAWLRWAEERLRRLELGPPWEPAGVRHYHARLAFQILDTNAVPALLDAAFRSPIHVEQDELGYEAAFALTWLTSPEARRLIQERIAQALRALDAVSRRNGCLVVAAGNFHGEGLAVRIAELMKDADPAVRAAALRAAMHRTLEEAVIIPAVTGCLSDDHAIIRRMSAETLRGYGPRAALAQSALREAYEAEPLRPRGSDGLDDVYTRAPDAKRIRAAYQEAMRAIASPVPRKDAKSQT